jgi:hypothetical protein
MNNRDLIIQYIDTGIRLPEYQKTYYLKCFEHLFKETCNF